MKKLTTTPKTTSPTGLRKFRSTMTRRPTPARPVTGTVNGLRRGA